ncbi:HAD hydrolase-like protein [Neisseria shayeganii]|uniref:HAD hydrolase-like protein n=1 Tax=Neisseria shayeganii TaxID=607712 RepID=UPI002467B67B|nr:HAD hydrolase-like protein [Neisseria shayeganii]
MLGLGHPPKIPDECRFGLVIGDTTHDLNMAYNARCHAVSVATGAHAAAQLQTVPHQAMLDGIQDLLRWLNIPNG